MIDPNDDKDYNEQDQIDLDRIEHEQEMRDIFYDRETGIPKFGEL